MIKVKLKRLAEQCIEKVMGNCNSERIEGEEAAERHRAHKWAKSLKEDARSRKMVDEVTRDDRCPVK